MWNSLTVHYTRHVKCYSYHACTSVTVNGWGRNATVHDPKPYMSYLTQNRLLLNTWMDANSQLSINSFRQLFPDRIFPWHFLTFSKIPDISLTAVNFPDISRFSRQVVTLSVSLWQDPDDVPHCRILSHDKTEWRLITTLCGWRRCFVADQLWFMTRIWEEGDCWWTLVYS